MSDSNINKNGWFWKAPDYFSKWRVFPRIFITVYIYMVWTAADWFMTLSDPTTAQAGFVSVIVGAGAAWFGLYVNSGSTMEAPKVYVNNTIPPQNEPSYSDGPYNDNPYEGEG